MLRSRRSRRLGVAALWLAVAIAAVPFQQAFALITGGEGNRPIADPGWPKGAAAIFNNQARIAWWEGPPFGGGQWHAECRGDARAFNAVLADFARLEVKTRRVVVHDGVGASTWLNLNRRAREAGRRADGLDVHGLATARTGNASAPCRPAHPPRSGRCRHGPSLADRCLRRRHSAMVRRHRAARTRSHRPAPGSPRIHRRGRYRARGQGRRSGDAASHRRAACDCSASKRGRAGMSTRTWPRPSPMREADGP